MSDASGSMVVDIGGRTTEVGVISWWHGLQRQRARGWRPF